MQPLTKSFEIGLILTTHHVDRHLIFFSEFLTNEIAYVVLLYMIQVDKEICTGLGMRCDGSLDTGRRLAWAGVAATAEAAGQSSCGSSSRRKNCCLHPDISSHLLRECKHF